MLNAGQADDKAVDAILKGELDPLAVARFRRSSETGAPLPGASPVIQHLRALPLDEFLSLDVKPRAMVLAPVLPEKGLAMLYAPRGLGRPTSPSPSPMRWRRAAPSSGGRHRHLERSYTLMAKCRWRPLQERLAGIIEGVAEEASAANFQILAADYFDTGSTQPGHQEGQAAIEPLLEGVSLVIIDNVSTLATIGHDNEAESWTPVQEWLLQLRRRGISVLIVHHAGKGGQQRGTSRHEDVLDTVIALKRPSDYNPTEGARFVVELEKARGVFGEDAKAFEARLETTINGGATWSTRDIADADYERVVALARRGSVDPRHRRGDRHPQVHGRPPEEEGRCRRPGVSERGG